MTTHHFQFLLAYSTYLKNKEGQGTAAQGRENHLETQWSREEG